MGKVLEIFTNGYAGEITRSKDDVVISIRNASSGDIDFGAPVFLTDSGAVPFNLNTPQNFTTFLGFAIRVGDKTPGSYPSGQFNATSPGAWHAGDVMEVLVRGCIAIPLAAAGTRGGKVYIRKSDGKMTCSAGSEGTTVLLENVRIRNQRDTRSGCGEAIINKRNIF